MKKLLTIIALVLASVSYSFAQEHEIYVSANMPELKAVLIRESGNLSYKETDADSYTSFTVGANIIKPICKKHPWFIEYGGNLSYGHGEGSTFTYLQAPVSVKYAFSVGKSLTIEPKAGLVFRYFTSGSTEKSVYGVSNKYEWFGSNNRFHIAGATGVDFCIKKKFVIGVRYQGDITNFNSTESSGTEIHYKWEELGFKLGYRF